MLPATGGGGDSRGDDCVRQGARRQRNVRFESGVCTRANSGRSSLSRARRSARTAHSALRRSRPTERQAPSRLARGAPARRARARGSRRSPRNRTCSARALDCAGVVFGKAVDLAQAEPHRMGLADIVLHLGMAGVKAGGYPSLAPLARCCSLPLKEEGRGGGGFFAIASASPPSRSTPLSRR